MKRKLIKLSGFLLISLVLLGLASACAPKVAEKERFFWPKEPETPRFEWINTYYSERDFEQSTTLETLQRLIGEGTIVPLLKPFDIAVDSTRVVYVSEPFRASVRVFDFNKRTVDFFKPEGVELARPMGLWVDSQDRFYLADSNLQKILVFSKDQKLLRTIGSEDILERPSFFALDEKRDRLYVTDVKANHIDVFELSSGSHLFAFGDKGDKEEILNGPQGLAVDASGKIYVCDMLNSRVVTFDGDGKFMNAFGTLGDRLDNFEFPKDLAFDSDGNLHIVDSRKAAFLSYTPEGEFLLPTGGVRTSMPIGFTLPTGIWISADDHMYIVDHLNARFSVWKYLNKEYHRQNPGFWKSDK